MYSSILNCSLWNQNIINTILLQGNDYYISRLRFRTNHSTNYLTTDEIFGLIRINEIDYYLNLFDLNDHLSNYKEAKWTYKNLKLKLNEFYTSNCNSLLVIVNDFTYAIIKCDNYLYLFDSHSKSPTGRISANGTASIMKFSLPNTTLKLARYLSKLFSNDSTFTFTYSKVYNQNNLINYHNHSNTTPSLNIPINYADANANHGKI